MPTQNVIIKFELAMMKNLLGMAKEKKQAQPNIPAQNKMMFQPGKRMAYDEYSEEGELVDQEMDEDYEPSQQEIFQYAEFLGIDPIRQKDLMYIAKEGLVAPLPEQWKPHQTKNNEVYYVNIDTGEKMWEHPCDEYYQQLVQKQRAKKINKQIESKVKAKEQKETYENRPLTMAASQIKPKPKPIDPLLKLEQDKKMKRAEQQRKQDLQKRKKQLDHSYQLKKDELVKTNRNREDTLRSKNMRQEQELAASHRQKASEKHHSEQLRFEKELEDFRKQLRESLESTYKQRLAAEKASLQQTYRTKKEEARRNLEAQFKKKKKAMDDQFAQSMKELEDKQKQLRSINIVKENNFDKEMEKLKQQYIDEKLAEKSHVLDAQRAKQEKLYNDQVAKLLEENNMRVANIDKQSGPVAPEISLEPFVKELEENYQKRMKVFNIQLASIRQLREAEVQQHLMEYEALLEEAHRERCGKINREHGRKHLKELERADMEFQLKVSELEKQANDDYLRSLNEFEQRYEREENNVMGHFHNERLQRKDQQSGEEQEVTRLTKQIERLQEESVKLKKLMSKVELQCENSRSHLQREQTEKGALYSRLTSQQKDLYDLVSDRERISYRRQKQHEMQAANP